MVFNQIIYTNYIKSHWVEALITSRMIPHLITIAYTDFLNIVKVPSTVYFAKSGATMHFKVDQLRPFFLLDLINWRLEFFFEDLLNRLYIMRTWFCLNVLQLWVINLGSQKNLYYLTALWHRHRAATTTSTLKIPSETTKPSLSDITKKLH